MDEMTRAAAPTDDLDRVLSEGGPLAGRLATLTSVVAPIDPRVRRDHLDRMADAVVDASRPALRSTRRLRRGLAIGAFKVVVGTSAAAAAVGGAAAADLLPGPVERRVVDIAERVGVSLRGDDHVPPAQDVPTVDSPGSPEVADSPAPSPEVTPSPTGVDRPATSRIGLTPPEPAVEVTSPAPRTGSASPSPPADPSPAGPAVEVPPPAPPAVHPPATPQPGVASPAPPAESAPDPPTSAREDATPPAETSPEPTARPDPTIPDARPARSDLADRQSS